MAKPLRISAQLREVQSKFVTAFLRAKCEFENDTGLIVTGVEVDTLTCRENEASTGGVVSDFRIHVAHFGSCQPHRATDYVYATGALEDAHYG